MKWRNNSIALGLLISAIFSFKATKAQPVMGYSNDKLSVTVPAIKIPQLDHPPYTKVFLETGTGAFFILQTKNYQRQTLYKDWLYPDHGDWNAVVQLTTFYDTIRRPPLNSSLAIHIPAIGTTGETSTEPVLQGDDHITVTNAVNNQVLPSEMSTLAITYKSFPWSGDDVGSYNKSIIAFFYNNDANPTLFQPIPTDENTNYDFNGTAVKPIRVHNREMVLTDLSGVPESIRSSIDRENDKNYTNVLYIQTDYDPSLPERNIFISMQSSPITGINSPAGGSYKAFLIDFNNSEGGSYATDKFEQNLETELTSHDPNHIITTPPCLGLTRSPNNRKIDYEIRFVNDGHAHAEFIKIITFIPEGIQFPTTGTNLFTCTLGRDPIYFYKAGSPIFMPEKNTRYGVYRLDPDKRQITFTIYNSHLSFRPGFNGLSNVGLIIFSLKTNVTGTIQNCLTSGVSIVFDRNAAFIDDCLTRINCKDTCPAKLFKIKKGD